jgi:hypothetical protein
MSCFVGQKNCIVVVVVLWGQKKDDVGCFVDAMMRLNW